MQRLCSDFQKFAQSLVVAAVESDQQRKQQQQQHQQATPDDSAPRWPLLTDTDLLPFWSALFPSNITLSPVSFVRNIIIGSLLVNGIACRPYSPMSVPFYFNFGKHLHTVKYDDAGLVSTNKNLFMVLQAVPAIGSTAVGQQLAEYHYSIRVNYEDQDPGVKIIVYLGIRAGKVPSGGSISS
jgi:hypothetical protein